jgi:hypothetical protein
MNIHYYLSKEIVLKRAYFEQIYHDWEGYLRKITSRETKFPEPKGQGNLVSRLIPNEFGVLRHARLKQWNTFTSEHFRVSNLINHVTLRIKVKEKYSEWIWLRHARVKKWNTFSQIPRYRGKKVTSSCKYPGSGKNERN